MGFACDDVWTIRFNSVSEYRVDRNLTKQTAKVYIAAPRPGNKNILQLYFNSIQHGLPHRPI